MGRGAHTGVAAGGQTEPRGLQAAQVLPGATATASAGPAAPRQAPAQSGGQGDASGPVHKMLHSLSQLH